MNKALPVLAAALALAACANAQQGGASSGGPPAKPGVGRFVMAGLTNAQAPAPSARWQYGLQLGLDPKSITGILFNCDPLPGTSFPAKAEALRFGANGVVFAEGPVMALSRESLPWLFDGTTTTATCSAKVFMGGKLATLQVPINFTPEKKAATAAQLKEAHEFNSRAKTNTGATPAGQKAERQIDSRLWQVGYQAGNATQQVTEFVLPGQTVQTWQELFTRQLFVDPQHRLTADRVANEIRKRLAPDCKNFQWNFLKQDAAETIYQWSHDGCNTFPPQFEVARLTQTTRGVCRWAYASKRVPVSDKAQQELRAVVSKLDCE